MVASRLEVDPREADQLKGDGGVPNAARVIAIYGGEFHSLQSPRHPW